MYRRSSMGVLWKQSILFVSGKNGQMATKCEGLHMTLVSHTHDLLNIRPGRKLYVFVLG
jgi:hypothetical protein